jgi:NADP-dependent 3-hydroxy acid dehydrogenase YdfG
MARRASLDGKVAIITGASSGIGRASALAFAREGATPVLASRSAEKLERVAAEIRGFNPQVLVLPTDVSVREQVQHLVDRTVEEFGRIDILFNNAGNAYVGPLDGGRFVDDLNNMLAVSFYGVVHGTQAVLPVMKRQGTGHIINMSSVVGRKAFPHFGGYSITMHAISAFTDALRQELRGTGIAVTCVHPALTQTAMLDEVNPADMPPPFRGHDPAYSRVRGGRHRQGHFQTATPSRHARAAASAAARRCAVTAHWRPDRAVALKTPLLVPRWYVSRARLRTPPREARRWVRRFWRR